MRLRTHRLGSILWLALILVTLVCAACRQNFNTPRTPSPIALAPCRLAGVETEARCVDIAVPERREPGPAADRSQSRTIRIHVAVLDATVRAHRSDPIFVFAGGPGQAATSIARIVFPLFARINRERDIVFVDQRGTGQSNPLACTPAAQHGFATELDMDALVHAVALCATQLQAHGNDLRQYLTMDAVKDIDEIRRRLGYERINLWGASYGTRVALEYLREFPKHVRSAILDGPAPAGVNLPISYAVDADAALDRLIADCNKTARCASFHPELAQHIARLFEQSKQNPVTTTLIQPLTGRPVTIKVTRDVFAAWLRTPLYTAITGSLLPVAIAQATHGNFATLAALNSAVSEEVGASISLGMHLSVICGEDMGALAPTHLERLNRTRFGEAFYEQYRKLCAVWPTRLAPASFYTPIVSTVPVLILAGEIDPITPPTHGARMLTGLSQMKEVIAPNVAHGVSLTGCAPDLIEKFVQSPNPTQIDGACLLKIPRPPFFEAIAVGN